MECNPVVRTGIPVYRLQKLVDLMYADVKQFSETFSYKTLYYFSVTKRSSVFPKPLCLTLIMEVLLEGI